MKGKSDMNLPLKEFISLGYRFFLKEAGLRNWAIIFKGLMIAVTASFQFIFPGKIIDMLYPDPQVEKAIAYIVGLLGITLAGSMLLGKIEAYQDITNYKVNTVLRKRLNKAVIQADFNVVESTEFNNQLSFAQKCLERNYYKKFSNAAVSIVSMIFILITTLGVFKRKEAIGMLLLFALINSLVSLKCKTVIYQNRFQEQQENNVEQRELEMSQWDMVDIKYGKETRLFNLVDYMTNRYNNSRNRIYQLRLNCSKQNIRWGFWPALLYGVQIFIVYWYVAELLLNSEITVGEFTVYAGAFLTIFGVISSFVDQVVDFVAEKKYVQQLNACFIQCKSSENNSGHCEDTSVDFQSVEFKNVSFGYEGRSERALQDINITINAGDKISVVGCNGSGKSTFIKLLLGLYRPTEGQILVNGIDVNNWNTEDLRKLFSPVFQDYGVFGYTISDNVAMSENIDNKSLCEALEKAGVLDKINSLAEGKDTYIGRRISENGVELSGGERQKIALARAFYKDAPMLILDEPTAALSPKAEHDLYEHVWNMSKEKTVLFISHRLSSCKEANVIFTFDRGRLIETGTHEELMCRKGRYAELFSAQAELYAKGAEY